MDIAGGYNSATQPAWTTLRMSMVGCDSNAIKSFECCGSIQKYKTQPIQRWLQIWRTMTKNLQYKNKWARENNKYEK